MMKTLRVLDSSGDRAINFDHTDATAPARAEAQTVFERMLAQGAVAFKVRPGDDKAAEKVTAFSALEEETILVPRLVGG